MDKDILIFISIWITIGLVLITFQPTHHYISETRITITKEQLNREDTMTIHSEGLNCDSFNNWRILSRMTYNQTICDKFRHGELPCYVPIKYGWDINKEYCNFQKGDTIYLFN